jgi:hypothetical protein
MKWKHKASKVVVANAKLARYNTLFKEHTLLKLEAITKQQKTRKREAKWNELNMEFNAILDVVPLPTLVDEVAYYQHLTTYM